MKSRAALTLGILVLAGMIVVDRFIPPKPRLARAQTVAATGGVVACPEATIGISNYVATLTIANFGADPSRAQVTLVPVSGKSKTFAVRVAAGTVTSVRIDDRIKAGAGASAIVEYTGGDVAVSHSFVTRIGGGSAPCLPAGGPDLGISGLRTLNAETGVALVNPGTAEADVTVTLRAGKREITPERLQHLLVPPRSRRDFRLSDFVFDEPNVTLLVRASAGRVVAEGLVEHRDGFGLASAQQPLSSALVVAGGTGKGATLQEAAVGDQDAGLTARIISETSQTLFPAFPPSVRAGALAVQPLPHQPSDAAAAILAETTVGSPIVAGSAWSVPRAGASWYGSLPGLPLATAWETTFDVAGRTSAGQTVRLFVVDAGTAAATLHIRSLGGEVADQSVDPGRLVGIAVPADTGPVALSIRSDQPVAVVLIAIGPASGGRPAALYAQPATPIHPLMPVSVTPDPRGGVAAPLIRD